ncbi:MAG: hypothetical protein ABSC51_05555 [Gaiellaceae bacterium]|jgi:hypothetical protein
MLSFAKRHWWAGPTVLAACLLALAGCGGNASSSNTTMESATAEASQAAWGSTGPYRSLESLAVFRCPRRLSDKLPSVLINTGRYASGNPHPGNSRRLLSASTGVPALYAWPTGKNGVCLGLANGASADCRPLGLPRARQAFPFTVFVASGRPPLAFGLIADKVTGVVLVSSSGARYRATVRNNAFLRVLPRTATSHSVRSLAIIVAGKPKTVPF